MIELDSCPHCNASLIGNQIPEDQRAVFGGATHFRRQIGIEVLGVYDGVLYYQCPDCKGHWHRWPEGHELRERTVKYWAFRDRDGRPVNEQA